MVCENHASYFPSMDTINSKPWTPPGLAGLPILIIKLPTQSGYTTTVGIWQLGQYLWC